MNGFSLSPNTDYIHKGRAWLALNPGATMDDWYRQFPRIVTFDTSAHNRIAKLDAAAADPIYAAVASRFFFRLAGLSYEELVATQDGLARLPLLDGCRKLTTTPVARGWDCVQTFYELLRILITAHAADPANFQWRTVDVRWGELAHEILSGDTTDDALATLQCSEQHAALDKDKTMWRTLRAKLDPIFETRDISRPITFEEAFENGSPALFPAMGKALYDAGLCFDAELNGERRAFDTPLETVQHFIDNCPPFRAVLLAMLVSWYNIALRDPNTGDKLAAGRNDLYMAVYLPLCDIFVTRDAGQAKCLRELRKHIGAPAGEVMLFEEFAGICA